MDRTSASSELPAPAKRAREAHCGTWASESNDLSGRTVTSKMARRRQELNGAESSRRRLRRMAIRPPVRIGVAPGQECSAANDQVHESASVAEHAPYSLGPEARSSGASSSQASRYVAISSGVRSCSATSYAIVFVRGTAPAFAFDAALTILTPADLSPTRLPSLCPVAVKTCRHQQEEQPERPCARCNRRGIQDRSRSSVHNPMSQRPVLPRIAMSQPIHAKLNSRATGAIL